MSDVRKYATPEAEHLAEQERLLAELTEQLATKETEFATTGAEFARFRVAYERRFAPLYAELDRLDAEIARRVAVKSDTPAAHAKAAEAASRAEESAEAEAQASEHLALPEEAGKPARPSPELRDLFREAAKKMHPDLAGDDQERARRTTLMAALNSAYDAGDADAVRRILDGEAARPEAITGDDIASRLVRAIRKIAQIRGRFTALVRLTEALETDPLFRLFAQVREAWTAGEDPLAEDEAELRTRIASAQAQLAALVMAHAKRQRPA
jgi:hypothetical protein